MPDFESGDRGAEPRSGVSSNIFTPVGVIATRLAYIQKSREHNLHGRTIFLCGSEIGVTSWSSHLRNQVGRGFESRRDRICSEIVSPVGLLRRTFRSGWEKFPSSSLGGSEMKVTSLHNQERGWQSSTDTCAAGRAAGPGAEATAWNRTGCRN